MADGFNSKSRDRLFFDGERYLPATFLTQKKLIMYLNLPNAHQSFNEAQELNQSVFVKKVILDKAILEMAHINVDILIDGLKIIFECPSKNKINYWITGFESLEYFCEQIKIRCQTTEIFLSQNQEKESPYYEKFDISTDIKHLIQENPNLFFEEFHKNLSLLEALLKERYGAFKEQKSIIVVPIMPKLATFGMKGYVTMNEYQQTAWLVGDAGIAFPAGRTGLSTGMINSSLLASTLVKTILDVDAISKYQLESSLLSTAESTVDKFRQYKIQNAFIKGGELKDITQTLNTAMTKFFRSCFDNAPKSIKDLVEVYNAHQMETFMKEAIELENQEVLSIRHS